ncbi:MAG: diaminopimelate epimerase [Lachnospiraceae bacterium]|nr:diaminopimelate epimerase [Lachnospiraceae bacterium]
MKFTKMQGCGNDYVYVDGSREKVSDKAEMAIRVSDRHFGIGSDGLIFINPSEIADFEMEMYNADGSRGRMCGNGIRCVAKYVYDHKLTDKNPLTVESFGSVKTLWLTVNNGLVERVRVNMGEPILEAEKIPVNTGESGRVIGKKLSADGREYQMTCVSMGNPHAVVYVDDVSAVEIEKTGPCFEKNEVFPESVNTEFVQIVDRNRLKMRVWERGSGETLACGTGACATVVASVLNGLVDRKVKVELLGGELEIEWNEEDNCVYMTGPAVEVFSGEI